MGNKTEFILDKTDDIDALEPKRPTLFICQEKTITEYRLSGRQRMGRPEEGELPDIVVYGKFVSRNHGIFETVGEHAMYHVAETTNGIKYNGVTVEPGIQITLKDGDEFMIPAGDVKTNGQDAVIIYASSPARIRMWRELQMASRDKLTGLCSREDFMIWWNRNHNAADYKEASLFIIDVDDFKEVNDKKGHNAGDEVLKIVAAELKSVVRYENQVCRWGGDEFIGIIPGTSDMVDSRLKALSYRIMKKTEDAGVPVTVSIGYVDIHSTDEEKGMGGVIGLADKALYSVKQAGKGGVKAFTSATL